MTTTRTSIQALEGCLSVEIFNFTSEVYPLVRQHREKYYAVKAPHLLHPLEVQKEMMIDERSQLFCIRYQDHILSSLRLTPAPFEVEGFEVPQINFTDYEDYLEISRLVTDPDLEQLTSALVVKHLLCTSGLFAIEKANCKGLIAMCRPFRASLFAKFGMQKIGEIYSAERQIYYQLLAASMGQILQQTGALLINEGALRNRLMKAFNKAIGKEGAS